MLVGKLLLTTVFRWKTIWHSLYDFLIYLGDIVVTRTKPLMQFEHSNIVFDNHCIRVNVRHYDNFMLGNRTKRFRFLLFSKTITSKYQKFHVISLNFLYNYYWTVTYFLTRCVILIDQQRAGVAIRGRFWTQFEVKTTYLNVKVCTRFSKPNAWFRSWKGFRFWPLTSNQNHATR